MSLDLEFCKIAIQFEGGQDRIRGCKVLGKLYPRAALPKPDHPEEKVNIEKEEHIDSEQGGCCVSMAPVLSDYSITHCWNPVCTGVD